MAPPHVRLIYTVVMAALRTHQVNSFLEKRAAMIRENKQSEEDEKNNLSENKKESDCKDVLNDDA